MDRVRKGDTVVVIAGKDKGKSGKVLRVCTRRTAWSSRASTMVKRHTKPSQQNPQGGIVEKEGSIHISNVMLVDPGTDKATRVQGQARRERPRTAHRQVGHCHRGREVIEAGPRPAADVPRRKRTE